MCTQVLTKEEVNRLPQPGDYYRSNWTSYIVALVCESYPDHVKVQFMTGNRLKTIAMDSFLSNYTLEKDETHS